MTRLHFVAKARKAQPEKEIEVGDSYYWWQFAFSRKQSQKQKPSRSQYMTRSAFLGPMYDIEDSLALDPDTSLEDAKGTCEAAESEIESLMGEAEDSLGNMPDALQSGPTGELLEGRASSCQEMIDALQQINWPESMDDEEATSELETAIEELSQISYEGE